MSNLKLLLDTNIEELIEFTLHRIKAFFKMVEKEDDKFDEKLEIISKQLKKLSDA
jgi:hypothetical protein